MSDLLSAGADVEACGGGDLVIRLITETGSLYELNLATKIWRRLRRTERSGELRAEGGQIWQIGPIKKGLSLSLTFLPFDGDVEWLLVTSPVVWVAAGTVQPATSALS